MKAEIKRGSPTSEDCFTLMGGDSSNPTWEQYVETFKEEYQPHIRAIGKCLKESAYYKATGNECANNIYFETEDGEQFAFTWRAWGDLMQALVNEQEGYIAYYM